MESEKKERKRKRKGKDLTCFIYQRCIPGIFLRLLFEGSRRIIKIDQSAWILQCELEIFVNLRDKRFNLSLESK